MEISQCLDDPQKWDKLSQIIMDSFDVYGDKVKQNFRYQSEFFRQVPTLVYILKNERIPDEKRIEIATKIKKRVLEIKKYYTDNHPANRPHPSTISRYDYIIRIAETISNGDTLTTGLNPEDAWKRTVDIYCRNLFKKYQKSSNYKKDVDHILEEVFDLVSTSFGLLEQNQISKIKSIPRIIYRVKDWYIKDKTRPNPEVLRILDEAIESICKYIPLKPDYVYPLLDPS